MLKNKTQVVKTMICCIVIIFTPYICAETTYTSVEIPCSCNPIVAAKDHWAVFKGETGVQYTLITEGLRKNGAASIIEVLRDSHVGGGRTNDGLQTYVFVEVRCIPFDGEHVISATGDSLTCPVGSGINVAMFEPNSGNPNEYHYIGILAATKNEEKTQEVIISNAHQDDIDLNLLKKDPLESAFPAKYLLKASFIVTSRNILG